MDVREVLPRIRVPTLVMHRPEEQVWDVRHSRYLAEHIPGARYVELDGIDSLPFVGDSDAIVEEIEEFLTGGRSGGETARALLTVMFTDIVDATAHAAALGDGRWRDLLARPRRARAQGARALRRTRGQDRRRRLPGDLRRPALARAALRAGDHDGRTRAGRSRCAIGDAHRRVRADRRGRRRHGGAHRLARQRARRRRARCSSRAPSSGPSSAARSASRTAAFTSSRACPAAGRCSRWLLERPTQKAGISGASRRGLVKWLCEQRIRARAYCRAPAVAGAGAADGDRVRRRGREHLLRPAAAQHDRARLLGLRRQRRAAGDRLAGRLRGRARAAGADGRPARAPPV